MQAFLPYAERWDPLRERAGSNHLKILQQGVAFWNDWRQRNPAVVPFLAGWDGLSDMNLAQVDLAGAMIWRLRFQNVDLSRSNLTWVVAFEPYFKDVDLNGSILDEANLQVTGLTQVSLKNASLQRSRLSILAQSVSFANARLLAASITGHLRNVDFSGSDLSLARFSDCDLSGGEFDGTSVRGTTFSNVRFDSCKDMGKALHLGPSHCSLSTIQRSPDVPSVFWESAGIPSSVIEEIQRSASEYASCFISYASGDKRFADDIYAFLRRNSVAAWKADIALKIGEPQREAIFAAIRTNERLIVILSKASIESQWVQDEVERAFQVEREGKRHSILPLMIDDTALRSERAWVATLRNSRNFADFSAWYDASRQATLGSKLLDALRRGSSNA